MDDVKELRLVVGHRSYMLTDACILSINEDNKLLLQHRLGGQRGVPEGFMDLREDLRDGSKKDIAAASRLDIGQLALGMFYMVRHTI